MAKFINELVSAELSALRKRRMRLRAIFIKMRKNSRFNGWSDVALYTDILAVMCDLGLSYSRREVYSSFKLVDRDDYDIKNRHELLSFFLLNAQSETIFK